MPAAAKRPEPLPHILGTHTAKKKSTETLYQQWKQTPSPDNFKAVMTEVEPVIKSALFTYASGNEALKTRATILAVNALRTYDPSKGASIKTHVYNSLQPLRRYHAERAQVLHIPENVRLESFVVKRFTDEFTDKEGREPNLQEISDGTGLSFRKIQKTGTMYKEVPESRMVNEKGDLTLQDRGKDYYEVWRDYVYHDLDDTNKKVFEMATGYGGAQVLPKKEIAVKLNISPAAVSQRINTIVKKLESGLS